MQRVIGFVRALAAVPQGVGNFLEYHRRKIENNPMSFRPVGNEGAPVGPPLNVFHGTMYDMKEWAILGGLTGLVLLEEKRVNAYSIISTGLLSSTQMCTVIQPRWVEETEAETLPEYASA